MLQPGLMNERDKSFTHPTSHGFSIVVSGVCTCRIFIWVAETAELFHRIADDIHDFLGMDL